MKFKIILSVIALVGVIGVVLVSRPATPTTPDTPTQIGILAPLTGSLAFAGEIIRDAADLAAAEVNAQGGIHGQTIELVYEDSQFDPKVTVSAYQALKLRGIKHYVADGSPSVAAIRQNIIDDGNFVIAQAATTPNYFDGENRTCRIALTANTFGPAIADHLAENLRAKRVAFLVPNHEYGQGMVEAIATSLEERGVGVAATEFFERDERDFRTPITKLKAVEDEIDVLFIINNASTIDPMFVQLHDLGWSTPIVSDVWTMRNGSLTRRDLAAGIVFADYEYDAMATAHDTRTQKEFKEAYRAKTGNDPVYLAAATYDSLQLLLEAIEEVGEDTAAVGAYISSRKEYPGVSGTLTFNDDCEVERNVVFRTFEG